MDANIQLEKQLRKQKLILESPNLYKSIMILALPIFLSNFMKAFNDLIDMYFASTLLNPALESDGRAAINHSRPSSRLLLPPRHRLHDRGRGDDGPVSGGEAEGERPRGLRAIVAPLFSHRIVHERRGLSDHPWLVKVMGVEGQAYIYMVEYLRIRSFENDPLVPPFSPSRRRGRRAGTRSRPSFERNHDPDQHLSTYIFMKYFHMEVAGSAYGTLLGNVIIVPIFLFLMFKKSERHINITFKNLRIERDLFFRLFRMSWPAAVAQALTSTGFLILNTVIYAYGSAKPSTPSRSETRSTR